MGLLVGELHNVKTLGNFWVEHEVESNGTWEFDIEHGETMAELIGVSALLVSYDR
jgi:hypothetical protein